MRLADLEMVLDWARQEGWNPGLDDARAFLAADPGGFFLARVEGRPAAAISVVNHDPDHAFLGLYICAPEFRGQGHGFALWQAALDHAGTRSVGLDGVPEQQQNYRRSGFVLQGRTVRFRGALAAGARLPEPGPEALDALIAEDRRAVGHGRVQFAKAWFANRSPLRRSLMAPTGGHVTLRKCHEGVKIGPLMARSAGEAEALLAAAAGVWPGPLFIDIPQGGPLADLVLRHGFEPVFETARMVRGTPPPASPPEYCSLATLELG